MLGESVDEEDQGHHYRHELDHEPCEAVESLIETGRRIGLQDFVRRFGPQRLKRMCSQGIGKFFVGLFRFAEGLCPPGLAEERPAFANGTA